MEADVIRLFIAEASFIAGSKVKQFGYDETAKKLLIHTTTDDKHTISEDSLLVHRAGEETLIGKKIFDGSLNLPNAKKAFLGDNDDGELYSDGAAVNLDNANSDGATNNIFLRTAGAGSKISFKPEDTEMIEISANGTRLPTNKKLLVGGGQLYTDYLDVILHQVDGNSQIYMRRQAVNLLELGDENKLGSLPSHLVGVHGEACIQHSTEGTIGGIQIGNSVGTRIDSRWNGGVGTKAYTVGDIVKALKEKGTMAKS